MKKYIIEEEKLKELLYDHYVLDCFYNEEDWDEDADFTDIVNIDLTEYEEIKEC